jgi:ABC-type polysaccharide/polyol phosphate export permease
MSQIIEDNGGNPATSKIGLDVVEVIFGKNHQSFKYFTIPGLLLTNFYILPLLATALMLIIEKISPATEMTIMSGATKLEIFSTQIIISIIIIFIEDIIYIFCFVYLMGFLIEGSVVLMFLLTLTQGCVAIMLGVMISLVCKDLNSGSLLSLAILFLIPFVSGVFWPIEGMSQKYLQSSTKLLPQTLSLEAMRAIIFRGKGFFSQEVILGFASSFSWIIACLIIFARVLIKN